MSRGSSLEFVNSFSIFDLLRKVVVRLGVHFLTYQKVTQIG